MGNSKLLIAGVALAILSIVAFLGFTSLVSPTPIKVLVSTVDIQAGQPLSGFPVGTAFVEVTADSSLGITDRLITPDQYNEYAAKGALFARDILNGEPLMLTAIIVEDNPAGALIPSLANVDPNLVIVRLDAEEIAPESVRIGDRVDLAVAVSDVQVPSEIPLNLADQLAKEEQFAKAQAETPENPDLVLEADGSIPDNFQYFPPSTLDMAPYTVIAPMSKVIVRNAKVVAVNRDMRSEYQQSQGSSDGSPSGATVVTVPGQVLSIELLVPREAFEWVSMANEAGKLDIALLSRTAGNDAPPSMGVSFGDLMMLYYQDRGLISPNGEFQPEISLPK